MSVNGDTLEEPDETFTVTLSAPANLDAITTVIATGTIVSDDRPHASIDDVSIDEGDAGVTLLTFTVSLTSDPLSGGRDARLGWTTLPGSAESPTDFATASGTLTFAAGGPLSQTLTVQVNGDTAPEWDEVLSVELTAVANVLVDEAVGLGTVLDDDAPALSITDATLPETNAGTTLFRFLVSTNRQPAAGKDIQVAWATADRTALAGSDYVAASGSLTFTSAGATSAVVTVQMSGDTLVEAQEELAVVLSSVVNARLRDATGLGTIVDDDGAVIRVDPTATAPADGLTWASAYGTVQEGVNRAARRRCSTTRAVPAAP